MKRHPFFVLCEGRHEYPSNAEGFIFPQILNPLEVKGMELSAEFKLKRFAGESVNIYVSGLTVAVVAVINVCRKLRINLTLWHFDRNSGDYYPQEVK